MKFGTVWKTAEQSLYEVIFDKTPEEKAADKMIELNLDEYVPKNQLNKKAMIDISNEASAAGEKIGLALTFEEWKAKVD